MIRLEQVRGEMLERFERVDRRFAQNEQRISRMEQRLTDLGDRIEALGAQILAQLELLAWPTPSAALLAEPATDCIVELATDDPED